MQIVPNIGEIKRASILAAFDQTQPDIIKSEKEDDDDEIEMSKEEFKTEHKRLIRTLKSKTKKDDKKEVQKQEEEAEEYDVDLKKANGEGSKGGVIIGHTKSGKPIYDTHNHASHAKFSSEDHYDASEHHDTAYEKLEKKYPNENKRPADVQKKMSYHATSGKQHWDAYKAGDKQLKKAIKNILC